MFALLKYPCLLLMSRDINFEAMGRIVKQTGKTISRCLQKEESYYNQINRYLEENLIKKRKNCI